MTQIQVNKVLYFNSIIHLIPNNFKLVSKLKNNIMIRIK